MKFGGVLRYPVLKWLLFLKKVGSGFSLPAYFSFFLYDKTLR